MSETHQFPGAKLLCLVVALIVCLVGSTMAAPILPGGTLIPAPSEPDPTGSLILVDTLTVPVVAASFTGSLTSKVWKNDTSNPAGLNAYTFTYEFTNTDSDGSLTSVHRITISEYDTFTTDVSYQSPGSGVAPAFINRDLSGDVIGFSFENFSGGSTINPGSTSALMVVQTNTTSYAVSMAAVIDGSTAQVAAFAPVAIPEPASLGLLSLAALALARRRR